MRLPGTWVVCCATGLVLLGSNCNSNSVVEAWMVPAETTTGSGRYSSLCLQSVIHKRPAAAAAWFRRPTRLAESSSKSMSSSSSAAAAAAAENQQENVKLEVEFGLSDEHFPKTTSQSSAAGTNDTEVVTAAATAEEDEATFLQRTKQLCLERNLPLEKVKNARDLASVRNSPVKPGRVFRMGRVSDATAADIQLLFHTLNITTLIDTRSPTELKDDPTLTRPAVFENFTNFVWKEQRRGKDGLLKELKLGELPAKHKRFWKNKKPDAAATSTTTNNEQHRNAADEFVAAFLEDDEDTDNNSSNDEEDEDAIPVSAVLNTPPSSRRKERHFVSLMNEFKYVKGTVSKLRKRDITKAILKSPGAIVSRRVRTAVKKPFLDEINDGGLPMLNELLLRFGAPGIKYCLELIADTTRHPIGFYCTAGKDRTGMIAAIVLSLCGVEAKDIVEDYTLSANVYAEMNDHKAMVGALSQRNLDPKTFLGAPASVMRDTLIAIQENYGSVEGYCNWIGFGPEKQEKLRRAMMDD